jgi:phosphoribosylanthranilate isomerase
MPPNIRVKVCCIESIDEAWAAIRLGAAALGLVSSMPSGPGVISEKSITEIAARIPPPLATFLLTSLQDPEAIVSQHRRCRTNTIQFCDHLDPKVLPAIRDQLPGIRLVQVIHVTGPESVDEALTAAWTADALLLDSGNPQGTIKTLGGTGQVHDWSLSRTIRERCGIPVFLAGGLHSQNVAEAIRTVEPFGVDVCSGVRTDGKLDAAKLAAFIDAARAA